MISQYVYKTKQEMIDKELNDKNSNDIVPEGQLVYCLEDQKYYIYRENLTDGSKASGENRWLRLDSYIQNNNVYVCDVPDSSLNTALMNLAPSLNTGSLVYATCNNTLYYNAYIKSDDPTIKQPAYLENSTGYFYPLLSELMIDDLENDVNTIKSSIYGDDGINYKLTQLQGDVLSLGLTINNSFTNWDTKLTDLGSNFTNLDTRVTNLDTRVVSLVSTTENLQVSNTSALNRLDELANLGTDVATLQEEVASLGSAIEGIVDYSQQVETNTNEISGIKQDLIDNYVTKADLPEYDPTTPIDIEEFNNLKNAVTTNTNAIAEVSDKVDALDVKIVDNTKYFQDEIASTKGMVVSTVSGLQHNITKLEEDSAELLDNSIELNNKVHDHTHKLDGGYEIVDGESIWVKGIIEDLSDYKQHVEDTYAKPEDISGLLNSYSPDVSNKYKWVGNEMVKDLVGKTGEEIASERYSYNSIFDQIIFADYEPTVSEPYAEVALRGDWNGGMDIDWYDEKNRIILVKEGTVGPDGGDFYPTNVKDAMISYPEAIKLDPHFTNGPILKSDEKQSSIGFCKVQDENGDWDYYKKDNNIYHVPSTLEVGEYRYYIATYFAKGSPAINNQGLTIKEWNENIPVESNDYITIIASKPLYYTTINGEIECDLQPWKDMMVEFIELAPSCQCAQQFRTPRPLKDMYIWNDLTGGYAKLPMVNSIPAYMSLIIEDGYYKYSYDSDTHGHRGGIKVKIEF